MNAFSRTELLLGAEAMARLAAARVAVFGVGGVGGHAAEALARSGVGAIDVIDGDRVSVTNLNRQIIATVETLGRYKADVMAERLRAVNPTLRVTGHKLFYLPETADALDLSAFDYVIDAVDTVSAKLELAVRCARLGVPSICALGAGNKLDPTLLRVADLFDTRIDPLARVMRREAKRRGLSRLKVVFSTEPPLAPRVAGCAAEGAEENADMRAAGGKARRAVPGSTAFVPAAMGLILAREAVCDLTGVGKRAL